MYPRLKIITNICKKKMKQRKSNANTTFNAKQTTYCLLQFCSSCPLLHHPFSHFIVQIAYIGPNYAKETSQIRYWCFPEKTTSDFLWFQRLKVFSRNRIVLFFFFFSFLAGLPHFGGDSDIRADTDHNKIGVFRAQN